MSAAPRQTSGIYFVPQVEGGLFFRPVRTPLSSKQNLTTAASRVAGRLVWNLENHASKDVVFRIGYLKLLPARLDQSPALRDSVALLCSSYANVIRGLPFKEVLNLGMHGKALRSLLRALGSRSGISSETLAATSLMERIEVFFDAARPFHRTRHAQGVDSLMRQRDLPKLEDELEIQLAIENHIILVCHLSIVQLTIEPELTSAD